MIWRLRTVSLLMSLVIVVLLLFSPPVNPQDSSQDGSALQCGSSVTPEEAQAFIEKWRSPGVQNPLNIAGPPYCVPIAVHIVRKSDGTGGLPLSQLNQALVDANTAYVNTGITYFYLPNIDYIDDDDLYFNIDTGAEIDALRGMNVVADAINIYFTPNLENESGGLCGISSFTTSAVQGIVMNNGCTGLSSNPSTYPHEIGHYFDLYHTHETAFGVELVDGSNCGTAGDLLCDTPADPQLGSGNVNASCQYVGNEVDPNGDPYAPDPRQYMSYSLKLCRDRFSPLGEARAVATLLNDRPNLLNRGCPPAADAGPDQTVECTSPTTTPVALNGSGSSDADGDALSYAWSASGVVFDDATSVTPTGQFPMGATTVTLIVSDGALADTATVDISVVDTTPPTIVCPSNVTVECSGTCGTKPEDDAQLAAFFAGVSASDICDTSVDISDDGLECFPLGTTTVTFTATDDSGNASECSADVTVIDTTPPTIAVTLNRTVLWPPNHKLADITAHVAVTDICDPNPTFVLTSITSNEPDNGKGDGNTTNDIQGAVFGDPDTLFQLRSERKGNGDGRKYTIIYTASDGSGNSASDTVCVRVPHDQSGAAMASAGFTLDGAAFDPSFADFVLVIPSKPKKSGIDVNGNLITIEPGFDATLLDLSEVYVGNLNGVARPKLSLVIDVTGDGLQDLAVFYPIQGVLALASRPSAGNQAEGKIGLNESDGALGLHYLAPNGGDYLVSSIFNLGPPVPLFPTMPPMVISGGDTPEPEPVAAAPRVTGLSTIHPNPFNPTTTVEFYLAESDRVTLRIYDIRGARVATLVDEVRPAGEHHVQWNGIDDQGRPVATGVYFVRLSAGAYDATRKIVMIK